MSTTVIFINAFALVCIVAALIKDRAKIGKALVAALRSFIQILPSVLVIIVLVGLVLAFLPPDRISIYLGERSGFWGIVAAASLGSILHIPAITAFPLAASLMSQGAAVATIAAFITTLTMVGVVTLPVEIKEMGGRTTLLRNVFSFISAICVALIMGVIL